MSFTRRNAADYHSYLLRLWRDGPEKPWRASLQSAATGTRHFADIAHLLAFLQARTDGVDDRSADDPGQGE